jgi:kinetochore protein NDC80
MVFWLLTELHPLTGKRQALDYPIAIQKGSLKAISPHEWPKLLGALTWFVELLTLELEMSRVEQERALIDTENADLIFFEYLTGAYQIFMNGVDDTSALDRDLALKFDGKNAQIEEENATLERSMGVLSKDIRKLEEFAAKLPELKKKRVELVADIDKLKDFAARLEDHKSEVQRKLATHETDLAAKRKRLEQLMKEKAALQKQLDKQEASGIDFRKMVKDREELDEVVSSLRTQREMAVRMMSESEIQLGKQVGVVCRLGRRGLHLSHRRCSWR